MILLSFYQPETGEIAMTSSVEDEAQIAAAELLIGLPCVRNDARLEGYVRDGGIVAYPARPGPLHVFNFATGEWESGPLSSHKARKWESMKVQRDALEAAGFPYLGKQIDSDALSVQRITTACLAAQVALAADTPFFVDWTCADNTVIRLNAAEMVAMPMALATYGNALHETARELRALIDSADTVEAVNALNWPPLLT